MSKLYNDIELHNAAYHAYDTSEDCLIDCIQYCEDAISKGANIDSRDKIDSTPLHWACSAGNNEMVKRLIELGANIEAIDKHGHTPLYWAYRFNNLETMKILQRAGAKDFETDNKWAKKDLLEMRNECHLVEWEFPKSSKDEVIDSFISSGVDGE